jgi:hypothetical protein
LQGFHLVDGIYQAIEPTQQGWLWSQQLELYLGLVDNKLRFFSPQGELIPSPEERADQAEQEIARLKAQLRSQGLEPDPKS